MKDQQEEHTLNLVNKSGFPYQLRIEQEIRDTKSVHNWSIASHEHPWRHPDGGTSGFIDLVLQHDRAVTNRLVIECKRVKPNDDRALQWLFLIPEEKVRMTERTSCLEVARYFSGEPGSKKWRDTRLWEDVKVSPSSPESEFCILVGDDPNKQTILEARCANLLDAMDGLAEEEVRVAQSRANGDVVLFIFPVIITTASIKVCLFKPSDVSISDGTVDLAQMKIDDHPFIRFRKSLSTKFPTGVFQNIKEAHAARERTVFVVNGEGGLLEFLKEFEAKATYGRFAIQHYLS